MRDRRFSLRGSSSIDWRAIGVALCAAVLYVAWTSSAHAACYVAFVHGKYSGKPTAAQVKAYWDPTPADASFSLPNSVVTKAGCKSVLVRYDGTKHFSTGATDVATQLASFITTNSIPAGKLVIVAHSMGGLVTRYILNNSFESTLFPPAWAKVGTATKYLITSQTPHFGSKGADVVAFEAGGGLFGDAIAVLALLTQGRNGASDGMRRAEMEYASTLGGFMNDTFRTKRIYTIEGYRVGSSSAAGPAGGLASANTSNLDLAWGSVCLKPHSINANTCANTPGDGLVDQLSAGGRFPRSGTWDGTRASNGAGLPTNYSGSNSAAALSACQVANFPTSVLTCRQWTKNGSMLGAYTRWLKYGGDHQQGAWDFWDATTLNYLTNVTSAQRLGTYIGKNGLNLPL